MSDETNKTEVLQFRLTVDQLELLDKAYKHYLSTNKDVITRAEYIRTKLMYACLYELGMATQSKKIKHTCACIEVHTCGLEKA